VKLSSVVTQLSLLLPQLTDKLTTDVPITSLTRSGTTMTAQCGKAHGLTPGKAVAIVGAVETIPLASFTRTGTAGTITTTTDHDLTTKVASTVTTSGAVEAEFNGTFTVIQFVNRQTITVTMANAGPAAATGSPVLEGAESALRRYDSTYAVLETPTPSSFTFTHAATTLPDPIGTITARVRPRISSGVDLDAITAAYTEQASGTFWLFASLEDVVASKSRHIGSDAVDNHPDGTFYRQQVIQPLSLYLFVPVDDTIAGAQGRDEAEDLFRAICRSVLASKFDSGLFVGSQGAIQFVSHGMVGYNGAVYVHQFSFQQVVDLYFEDTVGPDLDVAFRDLNFTQFPDLDGGTGLANLTAMLDLDDTPL
jgi:hypothetical protein